ncbi:MAG TPA: endoribonuclease MazF [bacterium]|jgi:mRNA interferase MazF|nr:endoribonuclease MazF [bacterium]HNW16365.1 endoribonuclease MazF [bacterium]HOG43078.1 endoribonuclease MazF [bacterium]HPM48077.1 endoribonuclease MazF [bacterium]HPV21336.1 endoribonuclease MazF [bacterium]
MVKYIPEQGDIVWLEFDPQAGHEQSGKRPAIVISHRIYNEKTGLALFCPVTTSIKGYPFEVKLPSIMKTTGVVLSDQIKSLDWIIRKAKFIEKVPRATLTEVITKFSKLY